jgi:hypothetical protein
MNAMTQADATLLEECLDGARWYEQHVAWFTVALHRAQRLRERAARGERWSNEHAQALARAMQLRKEIRAEGFALDAFLEQAFAQECRA